MDKVGNTQRDSVARYEVMIVRFYNSLGCGTVEAIEEVPVDAIRILSYLDYRTMVEPMIANDLSSGLSQRFVAGRYGVGRRTVRVIMDKYKI